MRKFGLPIQFIQTVAVPLPLVSLSSWPLLLCFPCLCDLFCCFKAPGRCACCTSAAILSKKKSHVVWDRKFWFFSFVGGLPLKCCKRSKWPTKRSFCQIMMHKTKESSLFHRGQQAKCRVPTIYNALHKRRRWLKTTRERKSWRNWQYIHHAR